MIHFYQYLKRHNNKYPNSLSQDFLKLIYQSEFAGGHLIKSKDDSLKYLQIEIDSLNHIENKELYEYISNNIVRINLESFLSLNLDINFLNNLFYESSLLEYKGLFLTQKTKLLYDYLKNNHEKYSDFSLINVFLEKPTIFSHSITYKECYNPHYRVINTMFLPLEFRILKLQKFIDSLDLSKLNIIAVEGRCASGKTTICNKLQNATIIHADDFFSKTDLLDYDLLKKLLDKLQIGKNIKYTAYSCQTNSYYEKEIIDVKPIVIIEGVYSYSNPLKKYYTNLVYIETSKDLQSKRLMQKTNNKNIIDSYLNKWIPREEAYFNENNYIEIADLII